ncbi:hypothetical protein LTR85_009372 [Meristemomyces frigidus]|nr:hypothetical protein LTR85_009372 [Meristemomyces frigidus]
MKPTVGHTSSGHTRVGEVDVGSQNDRRPYRHSYDQRYHFPPPPPPPDSGRPGRPHRSPLRRRYEWPPQPTCEDEAVALAKEAGAGDLLKEIGRDEAGSRGTIDQDPIIQEVPEFINQHDRRFVVVSDSEKDLTSTGIPTPPTSEDERARKVRRRPSRLNTALDDGVPELSKRTSSPYAFTKPTKLQRDVSSADRFLSPDTLKAPLTDAGRRRPRVPTSSKPSSPRRDSVRVSPSSRKGDDYFSGGANGSDNAIADEDRHTITSASASASRANQYRSSTVSGTSDQASRSTRTSVMDFAAPPPATAPSVRRRNLDARRNTDTSNNVSGLPQLRVEKSRRGTPLMAASALSDMDDSAIYSAPGTPGEGGMYYPRSRETSYVSSRAVSPAASAISAMSAASRANPSPPRSPRHSSDMSQHAAGEDSPVSGSQSASDSRPSSPSPRISGDSPRLPKTDLDWSTLLAANASRRSKPPSRLQTSMRQESVPDVPRFASGAGPSSRPSTSSGLPYPLDDGPGTPTMFMPSERGYQYFPPSRPITIPGALASEAKSHPREASPAPSTSSRTTASSRTIRPSIATRHSVANVSPTEERPRLEPRHNSFSSSSQTKKELAALMKKGLPDCPRPHPLAGHDDWYTVIGAPNLAFCPDCVDSVFERTVYRPSIRRLPQLNLGTKVQCAFGASAWIRLAWLLTLQQQRTDLTLLKDLIDIEETSEPCPGHHDAVRSWYGLRDNEGYFVRDFHICYADVRKIERLLPTLSGFFVRLPHRASYEKRICGIRAGSNHFSIYLDALIVTHEQALASRKGPDPMPFVALVERKTRLRECTRDNMLMGGLWHFIPSIPALTVCEDCYEAVVEPEVKKNSDVAMRFNRTVQPVYGEGMGSSCQLYSRRMRKVFQRALQDNDLKYLARKANERRDAEVRLQERYKDVVRRAKRLSREGSGGEDDERRLERELERITDEWQAKWE